MSSSPPATTTTTTTTSSSSSSSEMAAQEASVEAAAAAATAEVGIVTDEETVTTRSKAKAKDGESSSPSNNTKENDEEEQQQQQQQDHQEEEKKDDAPKRDYSKWPLKGIREPHPHDVMFGRGGGTNHHPGNKRYRQMVEDRKVDYINSKRLDKPLVALDIIKTWRAQSPPGRFLKIDEKTGLWFDVGDKKAREKTSQALREKAPIIRKQQEEQDKAKQREENGLPPESDEETTEPLQSAAPDRPKRVMARDTTFGVEYIDQDEGVTLDGFSWREGIEGTSSERITRQPPPPPGAMKYPPGSREGSYGPPPPPGHYPYGGHGGMPPPPRTNSGFSTPTASTDERQYPYPAHGRYESWGSAVPPPPMPPGYVRSWDAREHSLGQFALPHASIGHPASYATFGPPAYSPHHSPHHSPHPPPPPPGHYPPAYAYSGGPPPPPPPGPYAAGPHIPSYGSPSRPPYAIDPSVASTWSGQPEGEIIKTLSGEETAAESSGASPALHRPPIVGVKPDIVKRATSNQNETFETKPDLAGGAVKRAALNRDSSAAANRLKELSFPDEFKNGKFDVAKEVHELSQDMGRSSLGKQAPPAPARPERVSTLDLMPTIRGSISEDSAPPVARPSRLEERTTTMDAIAASLEEEDSHLYLGDRVESVGTVELPKPGAWGFNDRLTTTDLMQMVNEPIPDDEPELVSGRRQAL